MIAIFNALAPIFLIMALGHALYRWRLLSEDGWHAVDTLTFYVLFPALLMKTLAEADLASVSAGTFLLVTTGAVTVMAAAMLAAYYAFRHDVSGPSFTSLLQGSIRFQSIVAVALSGTLYGDKGLTYAAFAVAVLVPLVQLYTVLALIVFAKASSTFGGVIRRLLLNPFSLACFLGFIVNQTGLPAPAHATLSFLGNASISLTLLAVGAGLRIDTAPGGRLLVLGSTGLRLVAMPLLSLFLSWAMGLTGLGRTVAVIAAGVPTAATAYTMARKMGGDAELMAQIITVQSLFSAVTLPFFIYVAEHV